MKTTLFVIFTALASVIYGQDVATYEYTSLQQEGNYLHITDPEGYEKIKISKEIEGYNDLSFIFKKIMEMEEDGWELFSSQYMLTVSSEEYFMLLRRKKEK
jgi:hypothetical protein